MKKTCNTLHFLFIILFAYQLYAEEPLKEKAAKIHAEVITIDSHTDTPLRLDTEGFDIGKGTTLEETGIRIDFPRMKKGGLDAAFFAVFIGQGECTPKGYEKARKRADFLFTLIEKAVGDNPELVEMALSADDIRRIGKTDKRAICIGLENGYPVGKDITKVEEYYNRGARYITLCHTANNDICDSSNDPKGARHNGVSDFGKDVITEMNRLGMIIDVSHISDSAFFDVIEYSKAPVVASHSCVRSISNNPRNLNDEMLLALKQNGGVIQMCIFTEYVKEGDPVRDSVMQVFYRKHNKYSEYTPEEKEAAQREIDSLYTIYPRDLATVADFVDHIDYAVDLIGIDHVGIGTDFDGGGYLDDLRDVSQMGNITLELVKRGYSKEEIAKIWGGNFLRVFEQVETVAKK